MKSIFTIPKVVKYDDLSKPWFVYFRYDGKLYRYKFGINYIPTYKERLREANLLRDALLEKLRSGWNPSTPDVINQQSDLNFVDALVFAMSKKRPSLSPKTISGYQGTLKFISSASVSIGLDCVPVISVKRAHIKLIMERAKLDRNWSNNAHNKHLNHLKAILSELIQWDIIESNPAHNIRNLQVSESTANIPASTKDIERIKGELSQNHPNFFNFILTIFHTGIRPEEILKINVGMVSLERLEIVLPAEITKTDIPRTVPINRHLHEVFKSMDIESVPGHFYLFGTFRTSGRGNDGKYMDFIPGPTRIKRDTATKRWHRVVKVGLGIDMNMYAMKHLGADKKILAGMDLDALRELYGHTSKLMTRKYARAVTEVYRREILDKSPEL